MDRETEKALRTAQKNEITEHLVYRKLAERTRNPANRAVLKRIADDELKHYEFFRGHTNREVQPNRRALWTYYLLARLLGLTFGIKLMEKGEGEAQVTYGKFLGLIPGAEHIVNDESDHEKALTDLLDEERLRYVGSIVLGLNDALVELTGALAGFTLALQDSRLIATVGLIMGIAAALSMAASEYLSIRSEGGTQDPFRACLYTGTAYISTVVLLVLPYVAFSSHYLCLGVTLLNAVCLIAFFTFYISVVREIPFRRRFFEMAGVSLGVAALSFCIGYLVRIVLNVDA